MSIQEEYEREKAKLESYKRNLAEFSRVNFDVVKYPEFDKLVEEQKNRLKQLKKHLNDK
jgi:hypothetical protein